MAIEILALNFVSIVCMTKLLFAELLQTIAKIDKIVESIFGGKTLRQIGGMT